MLFKKKQLPKNNNKIIHPKIEAIAAIVNQYYELVRLIPCDQEWKKRSAEALDELAKLREFLNKDMSVLV